MTTDSWLRLLTVLLVLDIITMPLNLWLKSKTKELRDEYLKLSAKADVLFEKGVKLAKIQAGEEALRVWQAMSEGKLDTEALERIKKQLEDLKN